MTSYKTHYMAMCPSGDGLRVGGFSGCFPLDLAVWGAWGLGGFVPRTPPFAPDLSEVGFLFLAGFVVLDLRVPGLGPLFPAGPGKRSPL
jgi:hypothetical protein